MKKKKILYSLVAIIIVAAIGTTYANASESATYLRRKGMNNNLSKKAEFFQMSSDELRSELNAGKTLWQVAEEKEISKSDMFAFRQSQQKEHLNQLVAEGKISQKEADEKSTRMKEHFKKGEFGNRLNRKGVHSENILNSK